MQDHHRRIWRRALRAALAACSATAVVCVGSRIVGRKLLFRAQDVHLDVLPAGVTEIRAPARDGVEVRWLEMNVPPREPGAFVVVHFHNNRETAEQSLSLARELADRGLGVVLVEYRGYGRSVQGSPSEAGLYEDAEAALDSLAARGIGPDRIVLWGTSLGSGVAAEMAARGRGARLVLVSPYTSIPDLVSAVVPFLPAGALLADHFDTLSKASAITIPTTVVHGDADEIVPFRMGELVAAAIPGARLVRIPGGRHGDLLYRAHAQVLDVIAGPSRLPTRR
jgi:alpha-beta hydrolase superfamily lysophospholipase